MTDFERINGPRVEKIIGMLDTISKSANSQRVSEQEIAALLAPVAQRMSDTTHGDTPIEDGESSQPVFDRERLDHSIMCRKVDAAVAAIEKAVEALKELERMGSK